MAVAVASNVSSTIFPTIIANNTINDTQIYENYMGCPEVCVVNFTCSEWCNIETCARYNSSIFDGCQPPVKTMETVIVSVWGILMLIGILGNGLVVYVMLLHGEMNTTNCYILNLAFSDLAFTGVVIPLTMLHYLSTEWIFGVFLCKFHQYLIYVTIEATCLTLTAMTIDRYYAIVHPIRSLIHRTPRKVVCVNCAIWIVALLVNTPFYVYHGLMDSFYYGKRMYCRVNWPSIIWDNGSIIYVVIVTYIIPLSIILVSYSRMMRHLLEKDSFNNRQSQLTSKDSTVGCRRRRNAMAAQPIPASHHHQKKKRKASKMIAVVVILFSSLWLPIHVFQLWFKFDPNFPRNDYTYSFKMIAHTLSYANSCCNPFVYSFLGDGFRKAVRRAFPRLLRRNEVTSLALDMVNKATTREDDRCTNQTTLQGSRGSDRAQAGEREAVSPAINRNQVHSIQILPRPECAVLTRRHTLFPATYHGQGSTLPSLLEMEIEHFEDGHMETLATTGPHST